MLKLREIVSGYYKATNIVSNHEAFIDVDMLGQFRGIVSTALEDGSFEVVERMGHHTIEDAANWIECQGITMTSNFDGSPMIEVSA